MGGNRPWCVALLVLATTAPGCLDAPPPAGDGGGDPEADASGEPDAGGCPAIVTNAFDGADWEALVPPGSVVDRAASWTRVRAIPSVDVYVYADLHTTGQAPIAGASLTVDVDGTIVSVTGQVGIAWRGGGGDDAYQLEVADGALRARRVVGGEETDACISSCPEYSAISHARLRLHEEGGTVRYQSASEAGEWVDVGSAAATDLPYAVVLYADATGPGSGDLTVVAAQWRACP